MQMPTLRQVRRLASITTGVAAAGLLSACSLWPWHAQKAPTTFFVTSSNPGDGANLGGLDGADHQCQVLATGAGIGNHVWRAYLSQQPTPNLPAINARDRIGKGPWVNAKGVTIATDVDNLHTANKIDKQTALTEKGAVVSGRGDTPNRHDILTGSQPDGRYIAADVNTTCGNWTQDGEGSAMAGHSDRMGTANTVPAKSWNSAHLTQGCSATALKATGGAGLLYCFAAK